MDIDERLKNIEIELAYLRQSIEKLEKSRVVEVHTHYTYILNTDEELDEDNYLM